MKQQTTHTNSENKKATKNRLYWATWCANLIMFTASWWVPPMGVIDGSVLRAACILLAIPLLATFEQFANNIKRGQKIKLTTKGLEMSHDNNSENNNNNAAGSNNDSM